MGDYVFQNLDDNTLMTCDPEIIYRQYQMLTDGFLKILFAVEPTFNLGSPLAGELQRSVNQNRLVRGDYLVKYAENQQARQKVLEQGQKIRKMEKEYEKKKVDSLDEQKSLQTSLQKLITESEAGRESVKKLYTSTETEFDNLLRDVLAPLIEQIENVQHEINILKEQKQQINSEEISGNAEDLKTLLEKSKTKLEGDLEEKNKTLSSLESKAKEIDQSKTENEEMLEAKTAFLEKITKDSAKMDEQLKELRKQAEAKRLEEDKKKEEAIVQSLPRPNHVSNLEENLIVEWFSKFGLQVKNFDKDFNDGLLICQIVDKIKPGSVNWNLIAKPRGNKPLNIFQRRTNCTVLIEMVNSLGLLKTGIGSEDITSGNSKMLKGFFRTLMVWESTLNKSLLG
ncbi:hypothetical protein EIN_381310 [Entamoeba invadens IP1]|uniref:Calponin-homology (CH) domain-containing protein n=2 Tax=Entamoeba invadens TaxID=33085 RepID=A0A0A1UG24_ENTIV|nr:hypothetical protein EIN_381310 [Entamoeba invadens IP1]ELP92164.1 hypothetical protein EIN_381310 [Entamoeba invadens IP1]BAN40935.1 hypothetical protein [Entamoeba invadens]|eukprot:XP_004258935.1 hypothetical protein EIN_381310 [Entamoeba invadens IP1]